MLVLLEWVPIGLEAFFIEFSWRSGVVLWEMELGFGVC